MARKKPTMTAAATDDYSAGMAKAAATSSAGVDEELAAAAGRGRVARYTRQLLVTMTPEDFDRLTDYCAANDLSKAGVARVAINRLLDSQGA